MNMITVKINGLEYNLKGIESEEYLHKVAIYVDKKVKNIVENNNKLSTSDAAILTALNVADDMFKVESEYTKVLNKLEEINKKQKEYEEYIYSLKKQLDNMEGFNKELQEKLKSTQNGEELSKKQQIIENLQEQTSILEESAKSYLEDRNTLTDENKELRFQLHSSKYKIIDLENKLIDNQIDLAKAIKKLKNPIEKNNKKSK